MVLVFHSPFYIITVKTRPFQQMLSVISKHMLYLYHCLSDCPAPLHAGLDYCLKVSWWRQLLFLTHSHGTGRECSSLCLLAPTPAVSKGFCLAKCSAFSPWMLLRLCMALLPCLSIAFCYPCGPCLSLLNDTHCIHYPFCSLCSPRFLSMGILIS